MLIKIFTLCNNFYNRRQLRKGHAEIGKSCLCGRIRIINIGGGKLPLEIIAGSIRERDIIPLVEIRFADLFHMVVGSA